MRFSPHIFFFVCGMAIAARGQGQVEMRLTPAVGQYALEEITFQIPGEKVNPCDPAQIAVDGEFTAPSDKKMIVPGFYREGAQAEGDTPAREGAWTLRFAPVEIGSYILRLKVSRGGQAGEEAGIAAFDSVPSNRTGFVRRSGRYFELSTGGGFFPIGANRCWGSGGQMEPYLRDMQALAEAGGNSLRVWLAPWWLPIENAPGAYDPSAAERLDAIIREAEALGLRLMICIEQHGNLQGERSDIALWEKHPYNAANGGPCREPAEFFSNAEARRLFRNRLRYIVARWGYSSSVMAWELFNEVELSDYGRGGFWSHRQAVTEWHREMARYLRECDPWGHLVATSSDIDLQRQLLEDGSLDLIQIHLYEEAAVAERLAAKCAELAGEVKAPILVGEFGGSRGVTTPELVTEGIAAAALAGAGAGAWPWLQEEGNPALAYARLSAAKRFLQGIHWADEQFEPMPVAVAGRRGGGRRVAGLKGRRGMLVVAWPGPREGNGEELALRIAGIEGRFACEVWDLQRGETLRNSTITADGGLDLNLAAFLGPVGFKLERLQ